MSPSVPVVPMYIPGRLRTASSPSRTERLVALYWVASFIAVLIFSFIDVVLFTRQGSL